MASVSMPTVALRIRLHCRAQRVARQSTNSPATAESGMLLPCPPFFLPAISPVFANALPVFSEVIQ